jgi:hypothetical protein
LDSFYVGIRLDLQVLALELALELALVLALELALVLALD